MIIPSVSPQAAAVFAACLPMGRQEVAHWAAVERATMRLAAMAGPGRMSMLLDEVERRRAVFAEEWPKTPRTPPHPHLAALESVADDVANGRFA